MMFLSLSMGGCMSYGPEAETVAKVDIDRYVGLWHEIASNPVFFNQDLVGVTAEYSLNDDGSVKVVNTGYKGSLDGQKDTITGRAVVVDTETNSKLTVQFDTFFGFLFKGNYWIVLLDDVDYKYAVVTDNRQFTLFVLNREPNMSKALYDEIVEKLKAKDIDVSRLKLTSELK
jgi:apolipoprotein D and lipocalin family protein